MRKPRHCVLAVLSFCCLLSRAGAAGADAVRLVSRIEGSPSVTANGWSWTHGNADFPFWNDPPAATRISADGRYVVFLSMARNLVAGLTDGNNAADIYLRDRLAGTTVLVSRSAASAAATANGESREPSISADGRYVVFLSRGTDLVAGQSDANGADDVFLFDRVAGTCALVSHAAGSATAAGDHGSSAPFLSADGSRIAFASDADDLIPGQVASSAQQIFVFDRPWNGMTLVSHAVGASIQPGNGASGAPSLSADGTLLAYTSAATDLAQGVTDGNGATDVFLYDWFSSRSALVSRSAASSATPGDAGSAGGLVSADGSHVVFVSQASDLLVGQSGPTDANVFLYRRSDAALTLVSHSLAGALQAGDGPSLRPVLSQDGSFVAFLSIAEDLVSGSAVGAPLVFLFRRSDGSLHQVSDPQPADELQARQDRDPRISADGSKVAYANSDVFTAGGVPLERRKVYLYDRPAGTRTLVSASPSGLGESMAPELSADGQVVAYSSSSVDLVEQDFNLADDVFAYERMAGTSTLVSRAAVPAVASPWQSRTPMLSDDGNIAVFSSAAPNLVPGQIDTNRQDDVFAWSRQASPLLVSRTMAPATAAAGASRNPAVSPDGDWIAFESTADNLVPGQSGASGLLKLALAERATGKVVLVSHVAGAPTVATPGALLESPVFSRDGRFLAFLGVYSQLLPGQTASSYQVFLYDRVADSTILVSHRAGEPTRSSSTSSVDVDLSADGRFVVFASQAVDLGVSDTNGVADVFLYDRTTGERRLLSRKAGVPGFTGNGASDAVKISSDGRWVLFASAATDLLPGPVTYLGGSSLFLYDVLQDTLTLASHPVGQPATASGGVTSFDLSADGRFAVFAGWDGTGYHPAFLYDRTVGERVLISPSAASPGTSTNGTVDQVWISADGRFAAFTSTGTDLVAGVTDANNTSDVFLFERETGIVELVSRSDASPLVALGGTLHGLSADGGQVLFHSTGALVPEDANGIGDVYLYENVLAAQDFHAVTLCRALDTRQPADGPALVSGVRELFTVPGACGVPPAAKAVVLNVTVAQAAGAGYLKIHPGNAGSPASSINFAAGQIRSNNVLVRLSTDGDGTLAITPLVTGGGTVHVILDVMGYFE